MLNLKVCFIGLGSIGRRHVINLKILCKKNNIELTIDALRRENKSDCDELQYIDTVYTDIKRLPCDYDVVFLTNPTQFHADYILKLQNHAKHFFIEKPIATPDTVNLLDKLEIKKDSVYYVASPLLYHPVIRYIKKNVTLSSVRSVRCICSSYLPEWRPDTDYREFYSAKKELGGGVSIDLIHEWDYLNYIFGMPLEIKSFIGRVSELEISSDDIAVYIARYQNMMIELHLDYFGRKIIRNMQLFTDQDTIAADLVNGTVDYLISGEHYEFSNERDGYQLSELEYFLDLIQQRNHNRDKNGVRRAIQILNLTQGIIKEDL